MSFSCLPAQRDIFHTLMARYSRGCLFGLAVECAIARLHVSTRTGLISRTEPGTNPGRGAKLGSVCYRINILGSQRGFDGVLINLQPLVDPYISDVYGFNWFPGVLDSANMMFGCGCRAGLTANLWGEGWRWCAAVQARHMSRHAPQYICTP